MAKKARQSRQNGAANRLKTKHESACGRRRPKTKKQIAIALLERPKGASITELQKALGWQAHSVRGLLSGTLKPMPGVSLLSQGSEGGLRRYRIEKIVL